MNKESIQKSAKQDAYLWEVELGEIAEKNNKVYNVASNYCFMEKDRKNIPGR